MKKALFILVTICCAICMQAQSVMHEDVLQVHYGGMWLQDSYLSPLVYSGQYIGLSDEIRQPFKRQEGWKHVGKVAVEGLKTVSEKRNNTILGLGVNGGWGAMKEWTWNTGASKGITGSSVSIAVGPYIGADFMVREQSSNVNKPVSFDAATDACAMAEISYVFRCKSTAYRLHYQVSTNLVGLEWLPDYWTSYYEVSEGVNTQGSLACGWVGNRHSVQEQLSMDFQLRHSTWRLGVKHEYLRYGRTDMLYSRQAVGLVVGAVFNYKTERTNL